MRPAREASIDALFSVCQYFGIKPTRAKQVLGKVKAAVACLQLEGRKLGILPTELEAFDEAFEHRERDKARRFTGFNATRMLRIGKRAPIFAALQGTKPSAMRFEFHPQKTRRKPGFLKDQRAS